MEGVTRWEAGDAPFRHWVGDLTLCDPVAVVGEVVGHRAVSASWVGYNNDCERHKWACTDVFGMGPAVGGLFEMLLHPVFVDLLAFVTGVPDLQTDPTLHGAGVHVVEPGGYLGPHLDYALHPKLPHLERRVNLIYFLTGGPGGAFELYDDAAAEVVARVEPQPGRAVVWCPGDTEFHGTGRVPDTAGPRVAACAYYLAPARPTATRKRALFVPHR